MIPQPPAKSVRPSRASARIRASADGGWMSEKYPLLAEEEECFFLTSPFIEPDGLERIGMSEIHCRHRLWTSLVMGPENGILNDQRSMVTKY